MYKELDTPISVDFVNTSTLYTLKEYELYVVSNESTRKLLCSPEIIGYSIPLLLLPPISDFLKFFYSKNYIKNINIVNILRGGLNFPIEEACMNNKLSVNGVSFLTSERVFLDKRVSRIESKYRKINAVENATIVIGDIIASGETLKNAVHYIMEQYILSDRQINNIIVFTIGTTNTIKVINELNQELITRWPAFKGICSVFFEGVFTTYKSTGIAGLNLPLVDFTIKNGFICPEYRNALLANRNSILEKCIIYDGGVRRFEQSDHISCILKYWNELKKLSDSVRVNDFLEEKWGYSDTITLSEWMVRNYYMFLSLDDAAIIYKQEIECRNNMNLLSLKTICEERLAYLECFYS